MDARTRWNYIGATALAVGGLGAMALHRQRTRPVVSAPVPETAPTPEEKALVTPLAVGSMLDDFTVTEIVGASDGALHIWCAKDETKVRLDVVLAEGAAEGVAPPATAGAYWVFYGGPNEPGLRLAAKLAQMLEANRSVTPPGRLMTLTAAKGAHIHPAVPADSASNASSAPSPPAK